VRRPDHDACSGRELDADPTAFAYTAGTNSAWAYAFRTDTGVVQVVKGS
jgi:hypothetical protein